MFASSHGGIIWISSRHLFFCLCYPLPTCSSSNISHSLSTMYVFLCIPYWKKTLTGLQTCQKTDILLYFLATVPKKESDCIIGKIPAKIVAVLAKYSQTTVDIKSFIVMVSEDPSNCIGQWPSNYTIEKKYNRNIY